MMLVADAGKILAAAERALGLQMEIRYLDMHHWREESAQYHAAAKCETAPRLESVAAHSWHVGYLATLLLPYFPELDAKRVYELAILHDALELITGDQDPTGPDGTGLKSYALDAKLAEAKDAMEYAALDKYLDALPEGARGSHEMVVREELTGESAEARFIKVCDKIQCLLYVRAKKCGLLQIEGYAFLSRYKDKTLPKFPELAPVYDLALANLRDDMMLVQGLNESTISSSLCKAA